MADKKKKPAEYMSYPEYLVNIKKGNCNGGRALPRHPASYNAAGQVEITAYV